MKLPFGCMRETYSGMDIEMQSNRHGFRDRLKCHLLQSIILSSSLIAVNVIDYHFHLLQ
jgi:hypothetical protein